MRPPDITYLTDIYFEPGALRLVPELLEKYNVRRPMLVTDRGIVASGLIERLTITPVIFDEVEPNPTEATTLRALDVYREHQCDGLIALGGGSPIDLAKAVGLLVHHQLPLEQYAFVRGGVGRITSRIPPLIAIPTTAGTGSEVGRAAVMTLGSGEKLGILSPHLIPRAAVCDPELTLGLPPVLTAGSGMDAISHCIETYCSPRRNSVAEAIALDGLSRGWQNIETAVCHGTDLNARSEMMLCSLHGGLTFQKGLGAVHSLSHPLGALTEKRLHHGTLNAVFLPHVLRFNAGACADKLKGIADIVGVSASQLPAAVSGLNQRIGLPPNLAAMGIKASDVEPLAARAAADHCSATNPRPLSEDDCRALYLAALE